ncbi:MAG TPA: sulfate ABC transporter substrate-binding protein [Rubrobacteraceae bacterium]|nr:sulfate ABC transporter substrate-binding protein [Rubrobacteraceae bacterium]
MALIALLAVAGCGGGSSSAQGGGGGGNLTIVAYSTPREAYDKLIPAFQKTDAGKGVKFDTSYGSSGEQSRAVEGGLPADVVEFSLAPDMDRLVKAGLVDSNWNKNEYDGMVTDSVVVIAVRKGNPKGIKDWDDLIKPGVEVITPNPFTSGGAKWNIMAGYGAQIKQGKSDQEGIDYLSKLFHNVPVQDKSAREALATFTGGKGDAMLAYENEAILAQKEGEDLDFVVPDQTILIENPVAVTSDSQAPDQAKAFVKFLYTEKAQRTFGNTGYRPVDKKVLGEFDYPEPSGLFTIKDLGGWDKVNDKFFDPDKGVMAKINREVGAPTE